MRPVYHLSSQRVQSTSRFKVAPKTSPVFLFISLVPSAAVFSWRRFQASFLTASSISFFSCFFSLITFCISSSSKYFIYIGLSTSKIISLQLIMVSLMSFSRSYFVFIKFRQGMFNSFAFFNIVVLLIYVLVTLK